MHGLVLHCKIQTICLKRPITISAHKVEDLQFPFKSLHLIKWEQCIFSI